MDERRLGDITELVPRTLDEHREARNRALTDPNVRIIATAEVFDEVIMRLTELELQVEQLRRAP